MTSGVASTTPRWVRGGLAVATDAGRTRRDPDPLTAPASTT
ncbi:hypothetical protein [Lipingzhangella halophila]|nr:hypothetical protein [Lipingzhangella halophila]